MCSNMFGSEHRPLYLPHSSSASRVTAGASGFFILSQSGSGRNGRGNPFAFEAELAIPLWDFCDTWQMFSPDHIAGRFSCSDVAIRTRGGVRMGVETTTPFRRRKAEDETVIATSPTRPSSALVSWSRRIPVRRGKPRPARPCQPNWRAGALVLRFLLKSGCGHDASFATCTDAKAIPLSPPQS
jgi:hypothetical protein